MTAAAPLPHLTPWNRYFWTSGARGVLRIQQCNGCARLLHPPLPRCPDCRSDDLGDTAVSGQGVIEAVTVNHQPWHPAFVPPYVIAVVALAEDPAVRLTTNIVNCAPDDAVIGLAVRVVFEQRDDVWLPLFEPDPDRGSRQPRVDRPMVASRDESTAPRVLPRVQPLDKFERKVVISGIALSQVGRRLERNPLGLMVDAALAAIDDAGLRVEDIDGLSSYPGPPPALAGTSGGGVNNLEDVLRVRPIWFGSGMEGAGQTTAVVNAMLAVASGICRHVLCVRGVWESTFRELQREGRLHTNTPGRISGEMEGRLPFGAFSAANWIALMATRHMEAFGTTREQLGAIAVNARRNASRNPHAVYREPITLDDYLDARMVTTPFGLFDCDVPCDGAVAVVVSSVDAAADLRPPLVGVEAVGTHLSERVSWDQGTLLHEPALAGPARHLWTRTDLAPRDVDVAEIYDGFTFNCLSWLELLGFCAVGEGGPFVEGGARIALDGELPLNTHGGQLSAGRLHGWGFLHEACVQLRGEGGARQVTGDPQVAILSSGGGHPGGAMLLTKWR